MLASAAVAALALPTLALGQAPTQTSAPTLSESTTSGFPDKAYLVTLPSTKALNTSNVDVTENGQLVTGLGVAPPGGDASGAILLIDASNSMKGAPIQNAMAASRAFLGERKGDLPVAIVVFGPDDSVLTDFTTDKAQLAEAVSKTPATSEGTHIYDALINAIDKAKDQGLERTTVVLLSDGTDVGSSASRAEALQAAADANVRVISVGLSSPQYDPETLKSLANRTGGKYVETATPAELQPIFQEIGQQLSSEYELTYRSLLPPQRAAVVLVKVKGLAPATAKYTTPALDLAPQGTFEESWIDQVITSPWLMIFVIVAVLALIAFAIFSAIDVRNRSLRRRMAQYVTVPSEEESRLRRAEVASMLADTAQRTVGGQRWWQRFETDVELAGFSLSALAIAGWTIVGGILASIVAAIIFKSLLGPPRRPPGPVRDALHRVPQGREDAEGVRGAARGQPRRARRRDADRPLDDGRAQRHDRQRDRAVEVRVPPRSPGRAAGRPARRRAHGDGAQDGELRRRADRARHALAARGRR